MRTEGLLGIALLGLLGVSSGCTSTTHVRYEVPLESTEARACVANCIERHKNERIPYPDCLKGCPGVRETENARCEDRANRRVACAEYDRKGYDAGMAAIIGSLLIVQAAAVIVILQ